MSIAQISEALAAVIGLLGVWFTIKQRPVGWFFGTLGSALYVLIFYNARFYAESMLQLFYVGMGLYGWLRWRGDDHRPFRVLKLTPSLWLAFLSLLALLSLSIATALMRFSNTDVPYMDAFLASGGLLITLLMARKYLENWVLWIIFDALSAAWYWHRDLHYTAVLYLAFAALAVQGHLQWNQQWKTQSA